MSNAAILPERAVCEQARKSRDPRFDGLFFTAVTSTGIYCRPVCPAPAPKSENVIYHPSAASAESAGFRPCLRCRPELSPSEGSWRRGDEVVARALKLIEQGALAEQPLSSLAARLELGERQLRRLFVERLGAPPIGVYGTRRLLFAKQLLTETAMPITEVALAAGFGSLRRFNTTFRTAYGMAPRELRKRRTPISEETLTLRLAYRPPYDLTAILGFLGGRALSGIEHLEEEGYARVIGTEATPAWLRITPWPSRKGEPAHALRLELHGVRPADLQETVSRVRRMFDLDADPQAIATHLRGDLRLRPLLEQRPGLRIPSGWDGFELAVRAILGQQVTVTAARTLATRLLHRFGAELPSTFRARGFTHLFPTPEVLAEADLTGLGVTHTRATTIQTMARALLEGRVDFKPETTLEDFIGRWTALPGIGPWTAQYLALRALGHPDAFPAGDLALQKAMGKDGGRMDARTLREHAERWRPWRGYATLQLWHAPEASVRSVRRMREETSA